MTTFIADLVLGRRDRPRRSGRSILARLLAPLRPEPPQSAAGAGLAGSGIGPDAALECARRARPPLGDRTDAGA